MGCGHDLRWGVAVGGDGVWSWMGEGVTMGGLRFDEGVLFGGDVLRE